MSTRKFKRQFDRKLLLEDLNELVKAALVKMDESKAKPDDEDAIWSMFIDLDIRIEEQLEEVNEIIDLATG